jgi:hypothetical protein
MSGYSAEGHGIRQGEKRSPFLITPIKLIAGDTQGKRIDIPEADFIIWSVKQGTLEIVFSEASEMPSCPHLHSLGAGNPGWLPLSCQSYVVTAFNSDADNPLIATIILGRRGY